VPTSAAGDKEKKDRKEERKLKKEAKLKAKEEKAKK
jgi:hypothetical protein